ncbi:hypothetical protein [Romboutsia sp.]|uniref:hypothetical protein n=1 Tax=Romboutsia sp. TaxID=1965302 RepID=UPI003F3708DB
MSCCKNKGNNQGGCCKNNKIDKEEYEELKEYLKEEIKDYKIVDYMDESNKHNRLVEVEFEDYILELEHVEAETITLDDIIELIIKNNIK